MQKRYATILFLLSLLIIVLTNSGCYTVLKMSSGQTYCPVYDSYEVYDSWYDPYYVYHPYPYYSYVGWYSSPWTYGYCDPYWTYSCYLRSHRYCYGAYDCGPDTWQKGQRRRGYDSQASSPRSGLETRILGSSISSGGEKKSLKKLRKFGTGIESKPARRSGMTRPSGTKSRTVSRSTPTVTRQSSSVSRQSKVAPGPSKAAPSSQSSAPARRRGSNH